jgi:hypothetical protein
MHPTPLKAVLYYTSDTQRRLTSKYFRPFLSSNFNPGLVQWAHVRPKYTDVHSDTSIRITETFGEYNCTCNTGHWPVRRTSCLVLNFDVHTCRLISCVPNEAISWTEQYTICLKESKIQNAGPSWLCTYLSKHNAASLLQWFNVFSCGGHLQCLKTPHSLLCILNRSNYLPHAFHLDLLTGLTSPQRAYSFGARQMRTAGSNALRFCNYTGHFRLFSNY